MRVALLCPYSLSRPGGVQGQVLGLARALRAEGHHAVVLAPADGPVAPAGLPPGAVVRLGRSLPLPANGSVAPVALGPSQSGSPTTAPTKTKHHPPHTPVGHKPTATSSPG